MDNSNNYWDFIGAYLPNYSSNDNVFWSDILFRYVNDEEVSEDDLEYLHELFGGDKNKAKIALINNDLELMRLAMNNYYKLTE